VEHLTVAHERSCGVASIGGERNKRNGKPNKAITALPTTWLTKPRTRTAQPAGIGEGMKLINMMSLMKG
jgi:hypothetical protein